VQIENAGLKCAARSSMKIHNAKNHQKFAICAPLHNFIFTTTTIGKKNLLNSNVSSTCPHNVVNFGPLAAEIGWRVWGTAANFNGFCVLASLLH